MAARRYELSDAQWERIKDMIPRAKTGRPPKDDRLMQKAMLWLARSGAAWADIPECYGPHQSVYSRFCKWRDGCHPRRTDMRQNSGQSQRSRSGRPVCRAGCSGVTRADVRTGMLHHESIFTRERNKQK